MRNYIFTSLGPSAQLFSDQTAVANHQKQRIADWSMCPCRYCVFPLGLECPYRSASLVSDASR
jgi:hypothetical protein